VFRNGASGIKKENNNKSDYTIYDKQHDIRNCAFKIKIQKKKNNNNTKKKK